MNMFVNRRSSQKPDELFYASFKQSFPNVGPGTSSAPEQAISDSTQQRSSSVSEAVIEDPSVGSRNMDNIDGSAKDHDATPKAFPDQWRLTPSLMDPAAYAFSAFTNQTPGYYTPTSGTFNNFYHSSAAGDLHTPGMGINTPLSMPHSLSAMQATDPSLHHFAHFNPNLMHNAHAYSDTFQPHQHQAQQGQQLFVPPSHLLQHQDSGYSGIDDSPQKYTPTQTDMQTLHSGVQMINKPFDHVMATSHLPSNEKFRFHTTLSAPTAMVRQPEEIPITYLNKGQAYTLSVYDTARPNPHPNMLQKYRTYVRVSFEDEQQRAKPGSCWQLWKEGRGTNEAHQRGGRLLAVEYVDPNQGGDEELRRSQVELETASFDGFAVTWYPNSRVAGGADCSISIRFNFLSTDFSHSKGVKGIPVRLCAKTELVTAAPGSSLRGSEVCFSKVKLFRDHGAERKLSNDVAHIKKSIEKLKQQISQAESGVGSVGKRKRSGSMVLKEGNKSAADEDLHTKLASLQDMFSSTRPVSVLFLRGEAEDDPDLYPVTLPGGEEVKLIQRTTTWESRRSYTESPSSNQSPALSSASSTPKRKFSEVQTTVDEAVREERSLTPARPVKIQKREHVIQQQEILALDVDISYQPPPVDLEIKPVACFYIRAKDAPNQYYRAIYVMQRTVQDLVRAIATKLSIPAGRITKVTHLNSRGLHIVVDEDVVRELPEGQDMMVEVAYAKDSHTETVKHEDWAPTLDHSVLGPDTEESGTNLDVNDALELWLNY